MKKHNLEFGFGWLPDRPDARDLMFSASMSVLRALPTKVDLRNPHLPILNQHELGSCTANAIASAHQFNQIKQKAVTNFTPSRLFVYYNERAMEGTVNYDSGAFIRDGFKSIEKQGVCPETMYPYVIADFKKKPPSQCYTDALEHQAIQYLRLNQSLSQLQGCLADGFPFVFGFTVYESFMSIGKSGIVPTRSQNEKVVGGHAVLAVGYDDTTQRFIVQNSWGDGWGDKGFFYMPYSYLTDFSLSRDFWTLRSVELAHNHK